jgi:hypothetical protein
LKTSNTATYLLKQQLALLTVLVSTHYHVRVAPICKRDKLGEPLELGTWNTYRQPDTTEQAWSIHTQDILEMSHSYGPSEDLLEILHNINNMNTLEKSDIHEARKEGN